MRSLFVLALGAVASAAYCQAVYTNYPAGGYDGWVVGGYEPAEEFSPTSSGPLDGIMVAIGDWGSSGVQGFTLNLYDGSAGNYALGNFLGSWSGSTTGAYYTGSNVIVATPGGPTLTAGDEYWLEAVADNNSYGTLAWDWSASSYGYSYESGAYGDFSQGYTYMGAFSTPAGGSPTPGPAALVPFGLGAIGMIRRRIRKA
jgi:MYXO-CTERM domain-containing protein